MPMGNSPGTSPTGTASKVYPAKRKLAISYKVFANSDWQFVNEPEGCQSNFWLNAVYTENRL
jgi:hypothetical protein